MYPSCVSTHRTHTGRHMSTGIMAHMSYRDRHMDLQRHTGKLSKANTETSDFKTNLYRVPTKGAVF